MPPHISRREDGRSPNFYVRLVAPTAVQPFLSKSEHEFRKSTGTADRDRALVIGARLIAAKRQEWFALLQSVPVENSTVPTILTPQLVQQIAGARLHSWVETDRLERYGEEGLDEEELAAMEAFCCHTDAVMRSVLAQAKGSSKWSHVVAEVLEWCSVLGYEIEKSDPEFPLLVREFAKAERSAQQFISARNRGDEPDVAKVVGPMGTRLSEMNARFIKYKSNYVGTKPVSMAISIWNRFIAFKGDVFLNGVSSKDIFDFFSARLFTDADTWSQGYVNGHAKRALKDIFSLARTQSLMSVDNPVAKLEVMPKLSEKERKNRLKPRYPFSSNKVNILFASEWYKPDSTQFTGKLRDDLAARYFGPLIGELHGSRVREFLQLMTGDILVIDGVLCFKFQIELPEEDANAPESVQPEAGGGLDLPTRNLKNSSVLRTIPVHPKLIELGFATFVAERSNSFGQAVPLFGSSVPNPGGKSPMWGRAFEQSFLRYVRDTLGFGSGYAYHSFRHQFEDRIRDSQAVGGVWPAGLGQFLSGRKLPRDADKALFREVGSEAAYGNGYRPSSVLPYLERLDFQDIEFPRPFHEWLMHGK
jgi:hypothetical protein